MQGKFRKTLAILLLLAAASLAGADPGTRLAPSPERGYELLLHKAYLPPDFDQETFDQVWNSWPEPLRSEAEKATADERRAMAYRRYGLIARPGDPQGRPLQYVVDQRGNWTMNCLACHQGQIGGKTIPGLGNAHFALATLTEEIRATKLRLGKPLSRMDLGSLFIPLGTSNGTTNAVMFGVALMHFRDADLNLHAKRGPPPMTHHDHDAPAWWNVKHKTRLYSDSFAPKGHRALMQFLLVRENGPEKFREWEDDFRHIAAYLESLEAPKYPYAINQQLAAEGEKVFRQSCAECHGTYGPNGAYPERIVPIDEVGTDPVRLAALTPKHRRGYAESWFNHYGRRAAVVDPGGYVAPPLHGVWASAPYFHNGSVPTLWHVLHPDQRPTVWRRTVDGYDPQRVGLEIKQYDRLPEEATTSAERRTYFDTHITGKSAAGHDFPAALSEAERTALLEYLKTL